MAAGPVTGWRRGRSDHVHRTPGRFGIAIAIAIALALAIAGGLVAGTAPTGLAHASRPGLILVATCGLLLLLVAHPSRPKQDTIRPTSPDPTAAGDRSPAAGPCQGATDVVASYT
jgi:hypothetical protein